MKSKTLPIALGLVLAILIILGVMYAQNQKNPPAENAAAVSSGASLGAPAASAPSGQSATAPTGNASPLAAAVAATGTSSNVDLTTDENGLSKATVVMTTSKGVIKFKFYPKDAPNTVSRMVELMTKPQPNGKLFYEGLTFHRVVPTFVVQGGDPNGDGTGGSGVKLKAEFNNRKHVEGAVAMARAADPDSADSQFYISLGTHPHLDHQYTVFGQVVDGMDVVRKIQVGDKIEKIRIE